MAIVTTPKTRFQPTRIDPDKVHANLARHLLADGYPFVYDHRASEGADLVDQITGRRYLDMFSFFSSSPLGHNHPKMKTPEFRERIADVAIINPSNSDVYTVEMAEAVETFAHHALPEGLPHLFFISGGAPAVENGLKVAFDWKVRKNLERGITAAKECRVLHFREAFHGRLGYTITLTNTADPRKHMYFPKFDWPRVDNPKMTFPQDERAQEEVLAAEAASLRQIDAAFECYPDEIAVILIEPVQCEGGDNHFRPEFLQALRRIADERQAMLMFDEVQTGMGVTGTMWLHEQLGVVPDILAFGKKAQICGVAVGRRVDEIERNVFVEASRINSTWGGSLVDMVRGQRYVEIMHEDTLLQNSEIQGKYLLSQLRGLMDRGGALNNVRGRGLLIAFDMQDVAARDGLLMDAYDAGLLLIGCGVRSVRVRPHLDVQREALDATLEILERVLPRR